MSKKLIDRVIRVDLAGELGADRIYFGQTYVLGRNKKYGPFIQEMWDQEKKHLEEMNYLNLKYRSRKSALTPFWSLGGFLLGAVSSLISPQAAMTTTMAVEKVITQHYNDQIRDILETEENDIKDRTYLLEKLSEFRDDEAHHHDTAEENDGGHEKILYSAIENLSKISIKVAQEV